jgi:hypothetical protein
VNPDTVNYDAFRVIAEVAITLTGFIGIVVVLHHRDRPFSRLGLATILGTSIGAVLFAFLPDLLDGVIGVDAAWRVSAGAFGLYHLFLIVNHQVRQRSIRANTPIQLIITLASLPVVGLKLAVGLGYLMPWAFEIYYLGLLWCVGIAACLFAMILFDANDAEAAEASTRS